ncbi:ABC transporter substrate-binding protein [Frigidibacter sp. SD6-1]|uniref:ABC transporter substrate-binding protein n=1 Tax=Frigidibacter sp. SD6-1 TaxID=3032581 RepID=UPI0024DF3572|nr:ABC transporter substrate-binding protein [Frigidibacter sp. SD6-1]
MPSNLSRRAFSALGLGLAAASLMPGDAQALNVDEARALIDKLIGEINGVINSGASESAMFKSFEAIFARYADEGYIAASALGPAGKKASAAQKQAFASAFKRYIAVKYGKRFREFIGGKIEVKDARPLKNFFEVVSTAKLQGQSPFEVRWHVFDKSGKVRFFNLIIEGVNMLASERTEIGAMLDKQGGNIDKLIAALKAAG